MKQVGSWLLPDEEEHLADWIRERGDYQTQHRKNALSHVKEWGVAVDIGAHVGLWSRDFAKKFGYVHAFEPIAAHRECFLVNVPMENVTLHPVALGDYETTVSMVLSPHSTGSTHVDPKKPGDTKVLTLDSFALSGVDFVKIDCEGYETYILKGAVGTLKRCRPIVCIEQKHHASTYYGLPRYAARDLLLGLGMKELSRVHDDLVFGW